MIPRSPLRRQPKRWQKLMNEAVSEPGELLRRLDLPPDSSVAARRAAGQFAIRVPSGYLGRMRRGDPQDPLLTQVLATAAEQAHVAGYIADPVSEQDCMPLPGLLHKYPGRVLLTLTGACAIHCRYCFRRHFPYHNANPLRDHWSEILEYIRARPDIREVIFSGGDPLTLSDRRLASLAAELAAIPHLERLRIHTRVPIVVPERVDEELLQWLQTTRFRVSLVLHCNHGNEIDASVRSAMHLLHNAGVSLLNQAVLLKGVNDSAQALIELSERLFQVRVLPYYLHQLDPVQGAAHFAVNDDTARALIEEVRCRLPGYLVPRLVREHSGEASKTPLYATRAVTEAS